MLNYDILSKKPLIFKPLTGLEVPKFDAFYTKIQDSHAAYERRRLHREDRKRKIGAGHPFKLPLKDRLVMLLMYYRLYVTSTLLGCARAPVFNALVPFKRRSPGRGKRGVKAKELTGEEKAFNRGLSRERVVVEHTISRLKKFRIMAHKFRNRLRQYDDMTDIACGLVNLRIAGTTAL